jgi:hypothetical protein
MFLRIAGSHRSKKLRAGEPFGDRIADAKGTNERCGNVVAIDGEAASRQRVIANDRLLEFRLQHQAALRRTDAMI